MKIINLLEYNLSQRQKQNAIDNKATIIVTMPPQMFLDLTTIPGQTQHILNRLKSKEEYQKFIDQGEILVHPFIDIDEKNGYVVGHEGRARAIAALKNGDKEYEVAIRLYPPSRELSIKNIPIVWYGQFNKQYKVNFEADRLRGTIKVLNDNVQRQYQKIQESWDRLQGNKTDIKPNNPYIKIEVEIKDEHGNNTYGAMIAYDISVPKEWNGWLGQKYYKQVGFFGWHKHDNMIDIKMVKVEPEYRKQRIALAMLSKLQKQFPDCKINFGAIVSDEGQALKEAYVFDKSGRMIDDNFNAGGIHRRCTNLTLKAFGICSNDVLYNTLSIVNHLKEANYNILDLHLLKMTYDNIKGKEQEHRDEHGTYRTVPTPERARTGKFAGKYYNWNKLNPYIEAYEFKKVSIGKFMRTTPPYGRFVVSTRNHAMALIDGKLYDFENKGPNKRMLTQCYMILTDEELLSFLQDHPTFKTQE